MRPRLTSLRVVGLALVLSAAPGASRAQQPIDVAVVVDVSRSMYSSSLPRSADGSFDAPDGTDPERIRWDAVQLILNLLSADDRVLVLAFNHQAPAYGPNGWVPGGLYQEFLPVDEYRGAIRGLVETFIHNRGGPGPNHDVGGTAIVQALQKARELHGRSAAAPGNRLVAILLTDGKEAPGTTTTPPPPWATDERALRAALGDWVAREPGRETPVYTVGLGSAENVRKGLIDLEYLQRIAAMTGGSFTHVQSNGKILETFRDLIWQLKGSWIKPVDMSRQRSTEDTMRGVVDLGVLAYAEDRDSPGPRNTVPPRTSPERKWSGAEDVRLPEENRSGKDGSGYLYTYFGPQRRDEPSPFKTYAGRPLKLSTSWAPPPPGPTHWMSYAKRTARPLLVLTEPTRFDELPRHQPLTVRVALQDIEYFNANQFRLELDIRPASGAAPASKPVELVPEPGSRSFAATVRLDTLPRGRGDVDYYTLGVLATGLPDPTSALAFYHLALPPRTLSVDNRVALAAAPSRVELSGETTSRRLTVTSLGKTAGEIPLRVAFTRPKSAKGPVASDAIEVRPVDPAGDGRTVRLRDGEAVIELTLDSAKVDRGVVYEDGFLEVSAVDGDPRRGVKVPVGLRVDLIELVSEPAAVELEGGKVSAPIRVSARPPGPPPGSNGVHIELAARGDGVQFSPEELWLERAEGTGPKARALDLAPGEPFRVGFRPTPGKAQRAGGTSTSGPPPRSLGEPRQRLARPDLQPAAAGRPAGPGRVRVASGSRRDARCTSGSTGWKARPAAWSSAPLGPSARRPVLNASRARRPARPRPRSTWPCPWRRRRAGLRRPAGADLPVGVRVADAPVGVYRPAGVLAGAQNDVVEPPAELRVVVNALEVREEVQGERCRVADHRAGRARAGSIEGWTSPAVRTGLRDRLRPEELVVTLPAAEERRRRRRLRPAVRPEGPAPARVGRRLRGRADPALP
ncbi:MAG: vWA domain-containing protein [Isosphaeraceae bacterium]